MANRLSSLQSAKYTMITTKKIAFIFVVGSFACVYPLAGYSQQAASVVNNAAPNANVSTNTAGGTNINQQLNNVYDTSYGFGPGIICRTPQFILNGSYGESSNLTNSFPLSSGSNTNAGSFSGSFGFAIPIGSSVISDCARYAAQIAEDRVISSELSFIRACAQLEREKLVIDPIKYPYLSKCTIASAITKPSTPSAASGLVSTPAVQPAVVKEPNKVLQRFNP